MSVSFYRKYRPAKFEELDLDQVRSFFVRLLASGKFAHSYLFTGPKGTGKTSAARILAMAVNCEENTEAIEKGGKLVEPCGECDSCVMIRKGISSGVVEIDAASNRGIDDIRSLRERVGLVPTSGKFSVFIIDEVHMLTKEAFNALLKTLEEPPRHVIFCLCTTEADRLPDTIVSRCTRVMYSKASHAELGRSLGRVVKAEKIEIEDEALMTIALRADGSFRDATKILEQLSSSGEKITVEMVEQEVGGSSNQDVKSLYELIVGGEVRESLEMIRRMEAENTDIKLLSGRLMAESRERMIEQVEKNGRVDEATRKWIEVLAKTFSRFADVPIVSLPLEMAVVEYGLYREGQEGGGSVPTRSEQVRSEKETDRGVGGKHDGRGVKLDEKKDDGGGAGRDQIETEVEVSEDRSQGNGVKKTGKKLSLLMTEVEDRWPEVLKLMEEKNHGLVTVMRGTRIKECQENMVTLGVGYKFHKERLEQDRYLVLLEEVMEEVFGGRVKLRFVLEQIGRARKIVAEHENLSGAIPEGDEELVKAAEEIFG